MDVQLYRVLHHHHRAPHWRRVENGLQRATYPRHAWEKHRGKSDVWRDVRVSEFDLDGKVQTCVHDNARNIECAGNLCEEWTDLGCFGHTLQLCVKPALELPTVSKTVARSRPGGIQRRWCWRDWRVIIDIMLDPTVTKKNDAGLLLGHSQRRISCTEGPDGHNNLHVRREVRVRFWDIPGRLLLVTKQLG